MLLDWYVRFRRIDEWPEVMATARSVVFIKGGEGPDSKKIEFTYQDASGCVQNGKTEAIVDADLFFLDVGDTFPLRYNPRKPERYFVLGTYSPSSWLVLTLVLFALIAAGLIRLLLVSGCK